MAYIRSTDKFIEGSVNLFFSNSRAQSALAPTVQALQNADSGFSLRLGVIEGNSATPGSIAKAQADAQAYADQKIAALVNSAPEVLDTLKELSDALGSDPSFATTIAGQIGGLSSRIDAIEANPEGVTQAYVDAADALLSGRIQSLEADPVTKTYVDTAISDVTSAYESNDQELFNRVGELQEQVSQEISNRETSDLTLSNRLDSLEEDSVTKTYVDSADIALSGRLDSLESDPTTKSYVDGVKTALELQITEEQTRAEGAEEALGLRIEALEQAPGPDVDKAYVDFADAALSSRVSALEAGGGVDLTPIENRLTVVESDIGDMSVFDSASGFLVPETIIQQLNASGQQNSLPGYWKDIQSIVLNTTDGQIFSFNENGNGLNLDTANTKIFYVDGTTANAVSMNGNPIGMTANGANILAGSSPFNIGFSFYEGPVYSSLIFSSYEIGLTGDFTNANAAPAPNYVIATYSAGGHESLAQLVSSLQSRIEPLEADPVTKAYVDAADLVLSNKIGNLQQLDIGLGNGTNLSLNAGTQLTVFHPAVAIFVSPSSPSGLALLGIPSGTAVSFTVSLNGQTAVVGPYVSTNSPYANNIHLGPCVTIDFQTSTVYEDIRQALNINVDPYNLYNVEVTNVLVGEDVLSFSNLVAAIKQERLVRSNADSSLNSRLTTAENTIQGMAGGLEWVSNYVQTDLLKLDGSSEMRGNINLGSPITPVTEVIVELTQPKEFYFQFENPSNYQTFYSGAVAYESGQHVISVADIWASGGFLEPLFQPETISLANNNGDILGTWSIYSGAASNDPDLSFSVALGALTLVNKVINVAEPTASSDAATKGYVDAADALLDGRISVLEMNPGGVSQEYVDAADALLDGRLQTLESDPVTKTYVDSQISAEQLARNSAIAFEEAARIAADNAEAVARQAEDAKKVNKAGDTMTGELILEAGLRTLNPIKGFDSSGEQTVTISPEHAEFNLRRENFQTSLTPNYAFFTEIDTEGSGSWKGVTFIEVGQISLSDATLNPSMPVDAAHVTTKAYVDAGDALLSSRIDALESAPGADVTKAYVDAADAAINQSLSTTNNTLNSYVQEVIKLRQSPQFAVYRGGGQVINIQTLDFRGIWLIDMTGITGNVTVNLPAVTNQNPLAAGLVCVIKDLKGLAHADNKIVVTASNQLIDGSSTYELKADYESVSILWDGNQYYIV